MLTTWNGDLYINGALGSKTLAIPPLSITGAKVDPLAGIPASAVIHQIPLVYTQVPGANIVAATVDAFIAYGAGTLLSVQAALTGVIPSGDRTALVDFQKSTGGGAFATCLSAPITLDTTNVLRTVEAATISGTTYVAGDIFRWIITLGAGSTGTNPQGLIARAFAQENAY